ncbi:hypothetical protein XELAEV_18000947mg [Xenopus laevis]|nr:hypothetical protein XELAEV_18000947mg [Xenopus laevis]
MMAWRKGRKDSALVGISVAEGECLSPNNESQRMPLNDNGIHKGSIPDSGNVIHLSSRTLSSNELSGLSKGLIYTQDDEL